MLIQQNGELKRSVVLEGTIESIDFAPIRRTKGKTLTTYQFNVQVEFEMTSEKVSRRNVLCHYYVRNNDDSKKGSEELICTLQRHERIVVFGTASASRMYEDEKVNTRLPLSVSVGTFILPDRVNALMASLTKYEPTVVDMEDDNAFETDRKKSRITTSRKRQVATKKSSGGGKGRKKNVKETPKYGFD